MDILAGADSAATDAATASADLVDTLHAAMTALRGRESEVLKLYFGLDGEEPRTLEDIGARFGITRERVRQIKDKALLRIRRSRQGKALEAFR
jgi:RNA polymerase primary sigma factor